MSIASELKLSTGLVEMDSFPEVCWEFTLMDSANRLVTDISVENISVFEDSIKNENIKFIEAINRDNNLTYLIAIDASLSMQGDPINSIKSALESFVSKLPNEDYVSIITFHDEVELISEFTQNKDSLIHRIRSIEAKGSITELYYGIVNGLKKINSYNDMSHNKVLIVLSDGKDEGTAYTDVDCIQNGNDLNIPIYSIGFHSMINPKYRRVLERISEKTGGEYIDAKTISDINLVFGKIENQVRGRNNLCVDLNSIYADSLIHELTFTVDIDNNKGQTKVVFRSPASSGISNSSILLGILIILVIVSFFIIRRSRINKVKELEKLELEKMKIEDEKKRKKELDLKSKKEPSVKVKKESVARHTIIAGRDDLTSLNLNFQSGPLSGNSEEITGNCSIGRSESNDIQILDKSISGNHCEILLENGQFYISDLKSTNGTIVDGRKVSKIEICKGVVVQLGKVKFSIQ